MEISSKFFTAKGSSWFEIGSNARIIPVMEAIAIKRDEDIAKSKWLYLHIEIVI